MVFRLNIVEKERIYNFFHGGLLLTEMCSIFLHFSPLCVFSMYAESKTLTLFIF
jgi:hypothetical protein